MPFTTDIGNKIINKVLRNTDFVHPTQLYASLHTSAPGETGANEVSGGGYVRKAVSFVAPTNKTSESNADLEFTNMPACTVTHIGVWSAASAGSFIWGGNLTVQRVLSEGDTLKISAGDFDVRLDT